MAKHLLQAFAIEDPDRFAQLLGASHNIEEAIEILNEIPDGSEGEVLAHLSPEAAERVFNGLPDALLATWLSNCPSDVGRRLLSRLAPDRRDQLIGEVKDPAKRRGLRRIATFPAGTIGAHMQGRIMAVAESATAVEVEELYRRQQGSRDCPAILLGPDERVIGLLDLAAFVGNEDNDALVGEFCLPVQAVYAESPLDSLTERDAWQGLSTLPVVDFQEKLVGYITRADVSEAFGAAGSGNVFVDSAIELSSRYMQFLAYMLTLIISRRTER
ncbi:MAG: hypothetical protein R3212_03160 [Xanthomonadales bacterium]|nr:hypothetical protein [Xanthomonadales bacterium]